MRILMAVLVLASAFPAIAGLHFSSEMAMSAPELGPTPADGAQIATDGETYVALWTDYRANRRAPYAARFRRDGTLLDRVSLQIAPDGQAGAVIWSGRTFLITYLQDRVVRVRTLTPDGALGAPADLFDSVVLAETYEMRMATNGDSVLLVTLDPTAALLDLDGRMRRRITMPWPMATRTGLGVAAAGSTYLVAVSAELKVKTQVVTADGDLGALRNVARGTPYGVDVASDGDRFLVAWGHGHLQAQFVTRNGEPVEPVLALTSSVTPPHPFARSVIGLVWRGSEYLLLSYEAESYPAIQTTRIAANGETRGSLFTRSDGPISNIITAPDGSSAIVGWTRGVLIGAFLDPQGTALRDEVRVALAARRQRDVRMARLADGVASAWIEFDADQGNRLYLSRGPGSTPVLVANQPATLIDVVVEGNTVWVLWTREKDTTLYALRYTPVLLAVDAAPVAVGTISNDLDVVASAAAGGGTVVVVNDGAPGVWGYDRDVEAHVLRAHGDGIAATVVDVGREAGMDHDPAVTWNGNAFVVAWASAQGYTSRGGGVSTNDVDTGFYADDRILTVRLDPLGRKLDASPVEVARGKHVEALTIAHGSRGTAVAWQPYQSPDRSSRRHTYAVLTTSAGAIVDLGGEDTYLASFAAHEGGFLLARAAVNTRTRVVEPEVVVLDAALGITDRIALPPFTADITLLRMMFDADVVGGPNAALAYARIADGTYGHVSRHFVRRLGESQRRRPSRK